MEKISRGKFLGIGALLAGAATLGKVPAGRASARAGVPAPVTPIDPDLVVLHARVLTMDAALPRSEAFAVKNGRFVAVGSSSDIRHLVTARTRVIDARGTTVLPGFIDCHAHPSGINELLRRQDEVPFKGPLDIVGSGGALVLPTGLRIR